MTALAAPPRLEKHPRPDRRRNRASRVFGAPYPYFDRRALRTPVPGWQLRLHRSSWWRALVGEVPTAKRVVDVAGALVLSTALAPVLLVLAGIIKFQDGGPVCSGRLALAAAAGASGSRSSDRWSSTPTP